MVKKKDFANYLSSALQNSMVTGIPQIVAAGNLPKKIVRAVVFVFCVVGFIYQSTTFMRMYFEYKTLIDVQVTYPKVTDLPAFTVCNINGVQNSKYCAYDPESCSPFPPRNYEEFCSCVPRYCKDGVYPENLQFPPGFALKKMGTLNQSEYMDLLQTYNDFIYSAEREMVFDKNTHKANFTNYKQIRCPNAMTPIPGCFTFDSILDQPDKEIQKINPDGATNVVFDLQTSEFHYIAIGENLQIAFHNARTVRNPFYDGYIAYAGREYKFRLKKTVKELLPPPYETMCLDYVELWKLRGGKGPTNERECIQECQKNQSLRTKGCVRYPYSVPYNGKRCSQKDMDMREFDVEEIEKCVKENCRPACWEEKYEVIVDEYQMTTEFSCTKEEIEKNKQLVKVIISYNGMQTTTYKYKPQFENIETFSYLGGYVGMWLGISLVAVFDFFETVVIMMKYPLRQLRGYLFQRSRSNTKVRPHISH